MRLVKQESNGRIHVTLNRREMAKRQQITEMMRCYDMKWDVYAEEFCGEPPFGYYCMKSEIMHDIREYREHFYIINIECMGSAKFDYKVNIVEDMYILYVTDGIKWYYAGIYNSDWYEQYFIDNTNILERRG